MDICALIENILALTNNNYYVMVYLLSNCLHVHANTTKTSTRLPVNRLLEM